mgnify:CR=1 FL=1
MWKDRLFIAVCKVFFYTMLTAICAKLLVNAAGWEFP